MNLKMVAAFKREFRMATADRGLRMNELLAEAFEAWLSNPRGVRLHVGPEVGAA